MIAYHRQGFVKFDFGLSMALGLFTGVYFGAQVAGYFNSAQMKRLYGVFLLVCGLYMVLAPSGVKERPKARPVGPDGGTPAATDEPSP